MTKRRSVTACVAEIKKLNTRFRKLKKRNGPVADRLATRKDELIDEMAGLCTHPKVIASRGAKRKKGPMGMPVPARRICTRCGLCENWMPGIKAGALADCDVQVLPHDEYRLEEGKTIKRLGINL